MHEVQSGLGARGFSNGALYDASRPDYSRDAVAHVVSCLALDASAHVLDLGAGTGIFSRQIAPYVSRVTAVEPSASMRESLSRRSPSIDVRDGRDVAIPLPSRSVDAVVVAQAFHWFDAPRALLEIHRVLTEGGGLALIWNDRDDTVEWVAQVTSVLARVRPPDLEGARDVASVRESGLFTEMSHARFSHAQVLTRDALSRLIASRSYVSVLDEGSRARLLRDVARVVEALPEPLRLPYVTDVYCARSRHGDTSRRDRDGSLA